MSSGREMNFAHTGPTTLAGRFLRNFWQPVYVSDELIAGHAKPIKIMSEELTLYRGDDGVAHVTQGRCPHRGVLLSIGAVEGSCVRCRYHGWKFDEGGQCVEQPFEAASFAAKVQIPSYAVQEYLGLIWVYLGEDAAPPMPQWPELEKYGRFHITVARACNYFQDMENLIDDVHQLWVHREGLYRDAERSGYVPQVSARETDFGVVQTVQFPTGFVRNLALLMPNAVHFLSAAGMLRDFETFIWNVPVDDQNHILFFLFLAAHLSPEAGDNVARVVRGAREYLNELPSVDEVSDSVMSGRVRWEDLEERPDLPILEDDIVLRSQGATVDRSAERLGSSDTAIILLRKLYTREMAAIEEGRPLTRFKTPDVETLAALADG